MAMGPMANTLVDEAAVENVIAYIQTFPDDPPTKTCRYREWQGYLQHLRGVSWTTGRRLRIHEYA